MSSLLITYIAVLIVVIISIIISVRSALEFEESDQS